MSRQQSGICEFAEAGREKTRAAWPLAKRARVAPSKCAGPRGVRGRR